MSDIVAALRAALGDRVSIDAAVLDAHRRDARALADIQDLSPGRAVPLPSCAPHRRRRLRCAPAAERAVVLSRARVRRATKRSGWHRCARAASTGFCGSTTATASAPSARHFGIDENCARRPDDRPLAPVGALSTVWVVATRRVL
jgi:hypothetical protein